VAGTGSINGHLLDMIPVPWGVDSRG